MGEKMGDVRMNPEAWIDFAAPTAEDAPLRGRFVGLQAVLGANRHEEVGPLLERIDHLIEGKPLDTTYTSTRAALACAITLAAAVLLLPGIGTIYDIRHSRGYLHHIL